MLEEEKGFRLVVLVVLVGEKGSEVGEVWIWYLVDSRLVGWFGGKKKKRDFVIFLSFVLFIDRLEVELPHSWC